MMKGEYLVHVWVVVKAICRYQFQLLMSTSRFSIYLLWVDKSLKHLKGVTSLMQFSASTQTLIGPSRSAPSALNRPKAIKAEALGELRMHQSPSSPVLHAFFSSMMTRMHREL